MAITGLITVRSGSSRLPNKCFLPFGDEMTVLSYVIRRAKHYGITPIICTTIEEDDDKICEIANDEKVKFYRGSVKDKLVRWRDTCREYGIKKFVTIDADDPFFDGSLSVDSYKMLSDDYDLIKHPLNQPNDGFYEGCVGYSINSKVIEDACDIKNTDDTEMMWNFIEKVPSVRIGQLEGHKKFNISLPIRLTLDYEEDYWLMRTMRRSLSLQPDRKEIIDFFVNNPDIYKINWFRNDDYKIALQA